MARLATHHRSVEFFGSAPSALGEDFLRAIKNLVPSLSWSDHVVALIDERRILALAYWPQC